MGFLEFSEIAITLSGGLALFLFGIEQLTDALKQVVGQQMKRMLTGLTSNRFKAMFTGAFVTAALQSSSVTTVLVVGFVSANLMTLSQSIGVIVGANIGTTITAQLIAFELELTALAGIAIGFGMRWLSRREMVRQYGLLLMGLGMVFYGMELMRIATSPLQGYPVFVGWMHQVEHPLAGIAIGALLTALVQSSSATAGMIIVLASQGLITLETGIALVFGSNIGTCITAMLAALGKPRVAVQAAIVHVSFNVLGVLLWVGFIEPLADIVRGLGPVVSSAGGTTALAAQTPRQIANAHTLFNVANALLFIWFASPLTWLIRHLIPEKPAQVLVPIEPKYLDELLLDAPTLALDRVRLELGRLGNCALNMVQGALLAVERGSESDLEALNLLDRDLDRLYGAIVTYLGKVSSENLMQPQSNLLYAYLAIANYLETIGDTVETNMVELGKRRLRSGLQISDATHDVMAALHEQVCRAIAQAMEATVTSDPHLAAETIALKPDINYLADRANAHLAQRLVASDPNRLVAFRLESEAIEYLKRLYYFAKRIARTIAYSDLSEARSTPLPSEVEPQLLVLDNHEL